MNRQSFNQAIVAATVGLFCLPLLLDLVLNGWTRVIAYFAPDAFYYLSVARNFAAQGVFTFDQALPTNGFHPLWQYVLGGMYVLTNIASLPQSAVLVVTMLLCITALSFAVFFLARFFLSQFSDLTPTFLLLPLGLYGVLTWFLDPSTGSFWANANGMETCLVLLGYSILMWIMVRPKFLRNISSAMASGALLGLICLARLDHGFFAVAFFVVLGIQALVFREWNTFKFLFLAGMTASLVLGLYLLSNFLSVGAIIPVSGTLKSTYPYILDDKIPVILRILRDPASEPSAVALGSRFSMIAIPMIPAFVFLVWAVFLLWKRRITPLESGLAVTGLFILLLGMYNMLYVPLWYQGGWYFPVSVLFVSLLPIYVASRLRPAPAPDRTLSLGSLANYEKFFVETTPNLVQYYAPEKPKLIEVDDGAITYSTNFPAMSWLGFTLDVEGVEAKNKGQLLSLAVARGYDRIASLNYFDARGLDPSTPSDVIAERLGKTFFMGPKDVAPFSFRVEFVAKDGRFAIIHVKPK
jgi:hypothetical protein